MKNILAILITLFTLAAEAGRQKPVAVISANPMSGYLPLKVDFVGSGSYDPDGQIVSYSWEFGDGSSSGEADTTHTYYTDTKKEHVQLTVTDDDGRKDHKKIKIEILQDRTPPSLTLDVPDSLSVRTATPTFTAFYSDATSKVDISKVYFSLDGQDVTSKVAITDGHAVLQFTSTWPMSPGLHTLFITVSDYYGNVSTKTISIDCDIPEVAKHYLNGQVVDVSGNPLGNVQVLSVKGPLNTNLLAYTKADGTFSVPFNVGGSYQLRFSKTGYLDIFKYKTLLTGLDAALSTVTMAVGDTKKTFIDASSGGSATNSTGSIKIVIPPASLDASKELSFTEAITGKTLQVPIPGGSQFTYAQNNQPSGTVFSTPADMSITNILGFPAGFEIPVGVTNEDLGIWEDSGFKGTVSPDGNTIDFKVAHFSDFDANLNTTPQPPFVQEPPEPEDSDEGGNPEKPNCPCQAGSRINAVSNGLHIDYKLPSIMRRGQDFGLSLTYSSLAAYPRPFITVRNKGLFAVNPPKYLEVISDFAGFQKTKIYNAETGVKPSTFIQAFDLKSPEGYLYGTGTFGYNVIMRSRYEERLYAPTPYFGGPAEELGNLQVEAREPVYLEEYQDGKSVYLNHRWSKFGSGWTLNGLERIYDTQSDGVVTYEDGTGYATYFTPFGISGGKRVIQKNSSSDVSTLHYSNGFFYGSSCSKNEVFRVDQKGRYTTLMSNSTHKNANLNCPKAVFPSRKGGLYIADSGNGRILYLTKDKKFKVFADRNNGDITEPIYVTEDNVLAVHFVDGSEVKTVSPFDGRIFPMAGNDQNAIFKRELHQPAQITYDKNYNLIVLDQEKGQIIKFFINGGNSRVLIKDLPGITSMVFDPVVNRYFLLDNEGRVYHWNGQGHKRIVLLDPNRGNFREFRGAAKEKSKLEKISAIAFSPEIGLVYASENGIALNSITNEKKSIAVNYLSDSGTFSNLQKLGDGSYVKTEVDKTITKFNRDGFITEKTYSNGQKLVYEYDENSKDLKNIHLPGGGAYSFTYDYGFLRKIVDPAGKVFEFRFDDKGNLIEIVNPESYSESFTYDSNHLLTTKTDEKGLTTEYQYKLSRVSIITYPGNRVKEVKNSLTDSLLGIPDNGEYPRIDPNESRSNFISPAGRIITYVLDTLGMYKSLIDGNGNSENVSRDVNSNPLEESSPEGRKSYKTYNDSTGQMLTSTDARGKQGYSYNSSTGKIASIQDAYFFSENFYYNSQGLLSRYVNKRGKFTDFSYNTDQTLEFVQDFYGNRTTYHRDPTGNIIGITDPVGQRTTMVRDAAGNLLSQIDPLGNESTFNYDELNRVTRITDALGGETTFSYLPTGELEVLNDPNGHATNFSYNEQDKVSILTNHLNQSESFDYDLDGNILRKTTKSGAVIDYAYDGNNKLVSKILPTDSSEYIFDRDSLLVEMRDSDSVVGRSFDLYSRQDSEVSNHYNGSIRWEYNSRGEAHRTTLYLGSNNALTTVKNFNENGTLVKQTGYFFGKKVSFEKTVDDLDRTVGIKYPNGSTSSINFDPLSRQVDMLTDIPGYHYMDYRYTKNGNLSIVYEEINQIARSNRYEYDNLSRLVKEDSIKAQAYNLDPVGNDKNNGSTYNEINQLLENSQHSFQYNLNGNLTRKTHKATGAYQEYTWNADNILQKVRVFKNASTLQFTITYKYDPSGRRIERSVQNHLDLMKSYTRKYVYNGEHIAAILDGEDNFIAGYLFDEGIDEPVVLVTDYNGDKELDVLSLVRDRQNSVKLIVNEKKEIVQEVSYSAYGETKIMNRGQKNPNLNNIFYYTSRELEPELGIYYYRARYYDPSVGRFLSEDPIGFKSDDFNFFRYGLSNPLSHTDPKGKNSTLVAVFTGCLVVAAAIEEKLQENEKKKCEQGNKDSIEKIRSEQPFKKRITIVKCDQQKFSWQSFDQYKIYELE